MYRRLSIRERRNLVGAKRIALVEFDDGVCCAPLSAAPLAEADAAEVAKLFAALADRDRSAPQRSRPLGFALAAAQQACEYDDLGLFGGALIELVEAGARSGAREVAAAALRPLEERTRRWRASRQSRYGVLGAVQAASSRACQGSRVLSAVVLLWAASNARLLHVTRR
jgi:hypothetical protein